MSLLKEISIYSLIYIILIIIYLSKYQRFSKPVEASNLVQFFFYLIADSNLDPVTSLVSSMSGLDG